MKLFLVHHSGDARHTRQLESLAAAGAAQGDSVTLHDLGPRPTKQAMNHAWRHHSRELLGDYRHLIDAAAGCDAVLLADVAIHPEAVACLPGLKTYLCLDELSEAHVWRNQLAVFDAVLHTNPAHRFQLAHWGAKPLNWVPAIPTALPGAPTLADGERSGLVVLHAGEEACGQRLAAVREACPQAKCFDVTDTASRRACGEALDAAAVAMCLNAGPGPSGEALLLAVAHGAMPLCENKTGLAHFFTPGEQAVGFDRINDGIALAEQYTQDVAAASRVAHAAQERFAAEYSPQAAWTQWRTTLQTWSEICGQGGNPQPLPRPSIAADTHRGLCAVRKQVGDLKRALQRAMGPEPTPATAPNGRWQQPADERAYLGEATPVYIENPEMMHVNKADERLRNGDPLDWPNILALNWSVTSLIGQANSIVEVGSGTGPFADFASRDPQRRIDCLEDDDFARGKAIECRTRDNVRYMTSQNAQLRDDYEMLVSIEVIVHVSDLNGYLGFCSGLADRAVFTTPNRQIVRKSSHIGPPPYGPHVREFAAGELYWVLRQHYEAVNLYYMPNAFVPWLAPMTIEGQGTPIIAECHRPIARAAKPADHLKQAA